MIIVAGVTREASRIAQLLVKLVTNVVERTTLRMYANLISLDPREDQIEIGHARPDPRVNVPTDVIFMKLIAVMISSENCTNESTDMSDLTDQVQSLFYH